MSALTWQSTRYLIAFSVNCVLSSIVLTNVALGQNGLRSASPRVPAVSALVAASPLTAQQLLHNAFRLSQSAQTETEFSEILRLCEQAKTHTLADEEAAYLKNVSSWAYNRRGELRAEEAANLMDAGRDVEAAQLDRQALADFNAAIRIEPKRWKALHNRGVSFGLLGQHASAINDFTKVVELNPQYANAWFNRAEIHLENGQLNFAINDYSEALKLVPEDTAAYAGRARAFALSKRYTQAIADFTQALELEPDNAEFLTERGELYARRGEWKLAAGDYRHSIELNPQSAHAYRCAAWLMSTCPEAKFRNSKLALDAAYKAYNLAKQQDCVDYTYLDTLAAAHANAGNYMEAKRYIRSALDSAPEAATAAMHQRMNMYAGYNPYRVGVTSGNVRAASTTMRATQR